MIARAIVPRILKGLDDGRIVVLYGARQVGKTTLAKQLAHKIDPGYLYLDCDNPSIRSSLSDKDLPDLMRVIGMATKTVVIDEGQRVSNIGLALKQLYDANLGLKIIVTGSSSFEITDKIVEPLTGRAYSYVIWPLSMHELVGTRYIDQQQLIEGQLLYGSYPEVATNSTTDVENYLKNLCDNYLYKDLLQNGVVRSEQDVRKLLVALAYQVSGEVSVSELSRLLGLDDRTVNRLLDLLEKSFIIHRLWPITNPIRNSVRKMSKVYFYDLGIRNSLINGFSEIELRADKGALWENFCINERLKYIAAESIYVNRYFWRSYNGGEVDYIEEADGKLMPYEFKWTKKSAKLPPSFVSSLEVRPLKVVNKETINELY